MKKKPRQRNIRRTITENYILVVGRPWMGDTASYRYELHGPELASIGKFTRANVRKWLDTHAGDFQSIQDFYATAGDKELHWATRKGEEAYFDTISGEENPRKRRGGQKNPFDLASLANIVGMKPMTVKLQKVAGKIQMSIEKPTKELLHKLGIGGRGKNPQKSAGGRYEVRAFRGSSDKTALRFNSLSEAEEVYDHWVRTGMYGRDVELVDLKTRGKHWKLRTTVNPRGRSRK
jgi:hypothetical protein